MESVGPYGWMTEDALQRSIDVRRDPRLNKRQRRALACAWRGTHRVLRDNMQRHAYGSPAPKSVVQGYSWSEKPMVSTRMPRWVIENVHSGLVALQEPIDQQADVGGDQPVRPAKAGGVILRALRRGKRSTS